MVTTTCQELAGTPCTIPLTGNSVDELKKNIFAHAQKHHAEEVRKMTPQDQAKMMQRIEAVWNTKSAQPAAR